MYYLFLLATNHFSLGATPSNNTCDLEILGRSFKCEYPGLALATDLCLIHQYNGYHSFL